MDKNLVIPTVGIREFVFRLAEEHDVRYQRSPLDEMAEAVTMLSGDTVENDDVELLVVALRRKDIINGDQMLALLKSHQDEIGV